MTKRALASKLREEIKTIWRTNRLAETQKASYIWLFKLMATYEPEDVLGCAKWLITWSYPTNIAAIYISMPRFLDFKTEQAKKNAWKY